MNAKVLVLFIIAWSIFISSCSSQVAGTSTALPAPTDPPRTPIVTATPIPLTATPVPTDTPLPTTTATEIPTPTTAPTATPENQVFRDDFQGFLQEGWTWENENPARWTITDEGWLQILAEDTALLYGQAQSNLLWYDLPQGDFAIIVHLQADTFANFQQAAIYLYEDIGNYIAINRGYCGPCTPGGNGIYMEYMIGGQFGAYKVPIGTADVYLKLESKQNMITGSYATSPNDWQRLGRFGNYFVFNHVGLGATNSDRELDDNADLVALFDYFEVIKP